MFYLIISLSDHLFDVSSACFSRARLSNWLVNSAHWTTTSLRVDQSVELSTSVSLMMSFRFSETPQFRLAGDITSFTALRISYVHSRFAKRDGDGDGNGDGRGYEFSGLVSRSRPHRYRGTECLRGKFSSQRSGKHLSHIVKRLRSNCLAIRVALTLCLHVVNQSPVRRKVRSQKSPRSGELPRPME